MLGELNKLLERHGPRYLLLEIEELIGDQIDEGLNSDMSQEKLNKLGDTRRIVEEAANDIARLHYE